MYISTYLHTYIHCYLFLCIFIFMISFHIKFFTDVFWYYLDYQLFEKGSQLIDLWGLILVVFLYSMRAVKPLAIIISTDIFCVNTMFTALK